ncbi:LacI family DNA-binding transcriptional regulator [Jiella sp. MQZ9-1]|uniref:LacI family DNA-binding transcriptional regulator n=1 Tax=Jiella flava TaxID=2816857 RepID=A0A939G1R9_9HYPH|nr:LacI family DNA-binding transcriptional regulator [Jiella flava]MBO0664270.1 LacI family DNA-binding transcriptional regulator [Jiella flava]MCD2472807.1 LacI family DNA-binding transcriptional regulator [Jiella flava]
MVNRPTISDLARQAGVSVATVDRVLNGRARVREETTRRVYEAATAIGYHGASLVRQRIMADVKPVTLGFVLLKRNELFYNRFARELETAIEAIESVRGTIRIAFVDEQKPEAFADALEGLGTRCDAVAATAIDCPQVTRTAARLREKGVPVYALLSDFAQGIRESYVGLNNIKAGRTAAWMISRTAAQPGPVAFFLASHRWHGHQLRETGFRAYFRERAPQFEILDTVFDLDTVDVTREATLSLMARKPDLAGIYVAGGGTEGAIAALRETTLNPLPSVVVNELTEASVAALEDGVLTTVIGTPLRALSTALVERMVASLDVGHSAIPGQYFLPFDLHVPESI